MRKNLILFGALVMSCVMITGIVSGFAYGASISIDALDTVVDEDSLIGVCDDVSHMGGPTVTIYKVTGGQRFNQGEANFESSESATCNAGGAMGFYIYHYTWSTSQHGSYEACVDENDSEICDPFSVSQS